MVVATVSRSHARGHGVCSEQITRSPRDAHAERGDTNYNRHDLRRRELLSFAQLCSHSLSPK